MSTFVSLKFSKKFNETDVDIRLVKKSQKNTETDVEIRFRKVWNECRHSFH